MAQAAKKQKRNTLGDDEYDVEDILNVRINRDTLRCEFEVKWEGYEEKKDRSWEPLDNVKNVPLFLKNLAIRNHRSILKSAGVDPLDDAAKSLPHFPQIPKEILAKMRTAFGQGEFFPQGTEGFLRGITEIVETDNKNLIMWKVEFERLPGSHFVRRDVVAYYWPEEAALFATKLAHKEAKFQNFLKERKEAEAKKKV
jgi:hypothetical protein